MITIFLCTAASAWAEDEKGWVSLFDGKTLDGWKIAENPKAFSVQDGQIVVNGERGHMFYDGKVANHNFKNFELKVELMTTPGSNSGIYIHTKYQESDWPKVGYEVQVNQTHGDPKKSSGLYGVKDVMEGLPKTTNGIRKRSLSRGSTSSRKSTARRSWTTPSRTKSRADRKLSSGTFAIQAHDPKSKVFIKSIKVKVLED